MSADLTEEELARLEALLAKARLGPLMVNRYDNDNGDINYQLQQDGRRGSVLCNIFESEFRNNRDVAEAVCGVLNAAETLLASARAVREVLPLLIAVRDDPAMHPKCGFVVRPCIRRAIEILTATAEQTAGEER